MRRCAARERVAVLGASGEGKSSLMQYVLRPTVEGLFPLPVPVALADPSVVRDPIVVRGARRGDDRAARRSPRSPARAGGAGRARLACRPQLQVVGGARVDGHQARGRPRGPVGGRSRVPRTGAEAVPPRRCLHRGHRPGRPAGTLVLDDTDKWVRGPTGQVDAAPPRRLLRQRSSASSPSTSAVPPRSPCTAPTPRTTPTAVAAGGFLAASVDLPRLGGPAAVSPAARAPAAGRPGAGRAGGAGRRGVVVRRSRAPPRRLRGGFRPEPAMADATRPPEPRGGLRRGGGRIEERHVEAGLRELAT